MGEGDPEKNRWLCCHGDDSRQQSPQNRPGRPPCAHVESTVRAWWPGASGPRGGTAGRKRGPSPSVQTGCLPWPFPRNLHPTCPSSGPGPASAAPGRLLGSRHRLRPPLPLGRGPRDPLALRPAQSQGGAGVASKGLLRLPLRAGRDRPTFPLRAERAEGRGPGPGPRSPHAAPAWTQG